MNRDWQCCGRSRWDSGFKCCAAGSLRFVSREADSVVPDFGLSGQAREYNQQGWIDSSGSGADLFVLLRKHPSRFGSALFSLIIKFSLTLPDFYNPYKNEEDTYLQYRIDTKKTSKQSGPVQM